MYIKHRDWSDFVFNAVLYLEVFSSFKRSFHSRSFFITVGRLQLVLGASLQTFEFSR